MSRVAPIFLAAALLAPWTAGHPDSRARNQAPADAPDIDPQAVARIAALASSDAVTAARAELDLIGMGPRATGALAAWMGSPTRDPRVATAILRVIGRVRDPRAVAILLPEWDRNPDGRDQLIETWAAYSESGISPLAGYFPTATPDQQERILDAIGATGDAGVPALKGIEGMLQQEQGGLPDRLRERIRLLLENAPVVTLARKGLVARTDLLRIAADPGSPLAHAEIAIRGLIALGDAGADAVAGLAGLDLRPPLKAIVVPLADEARLVTLAKQGDSAIPAYVALLRDPMASETLKMGAVNGLFGFGTSALPLMETLAEEIPVSRAKDYLREVVVTLRSMKQDGAASPAIPLPSAPSSPAAPGSQRASDAGALAAGPVCVPGAPFASVARIDAGGRRISPRWFARSASGRRIAWTEVEKGRYRIRIASPAGEDAQTVQQPVHAFAPALSFDGERLAFLGNAAPIGDPLRLNDVYIALAAGGEPRKISGAQAAHASPAWLGRLGEILYAANAPRPAGSPGAEPPWEATIHHHGEQAGLTKTVLTLPGRIVTSIEPAPDGRRFAFLSWKPDRDEAAGPWLHVLDASGEGHREMAIPTAAETDPGAALALDEALRIGGDLTWSADGRFVATAGWVIEAEPWILAGRIDPSGVAYALRHASRILMTTDGACGYFSDTRQIHYRCLSRPGGRVVADCRGALLWIERTSHRVAVFDEPSGSFGFVSIP